MTEDRTYWVYVLASRFRGTLYVGITNSLERRIAEHRNRQSPGFTRTYGVDRLVYFQGFGEVGDAIHFEKQLKRWRRDWKVRLIEEDNPTGRTSYLDMMALPPMRPDIAAALAENGKSNNNNACHPGLGAAQDRDPSAPGLEKWHDITAAFPSANAELMGPGLRHSAKPG